MNTEIFEVQPDQASSFLDQFLAGEEIKIEQSPTIIPQNLQQQKPIDDSQQDDSIVEGEEVTVDSVQNLLNKDKEKEKEEAEKKQESPEKLFDKLHEQGLIFPYEDGSKPQTFEEIADALKQSSEVTVSERIQQAWENKISSLSPSIQTIIQYAESGVSTATEINSLINAVSYYERVNELDPTKVEDQPQIVYLHLLNTGLNEQEAKEQLELYEESKTLEKSAKTFHPSLKKIYENQIKDDFAVQQQKQDDATRYIQTNATNARYFLENETTYLPFKISRNHKAAVMELSAKPLGYGENLEPVFGYNEYLKQLQNGTEEQYKEFMEVMTFMADRKAYKEKLSSVVASDTTKKNFKKVAVTSGNVTNKDEQQEIYQGRTIQKKEALPWSV